MPHNKHTHSHPTASHNSAHSRHSAASKLAGAGSSNNLKHIPTQAEVLSKALVNVAINLDLSQKELSEIIGASKSEISRLFNKKSYIYPSTKEGECALILIRIYRSLDALLGEDERQSQEWFKNYNNHLSAKPIELSKKISGLVEVVTYLDAMRGLA